MLTCFYLKKEFFSAKGRLAASSQKDTQQLMLLPKSCYNNYCCLMAFEVFKRLFAGIALIERFACSGTEPAEHYRII